MKIALAQFNPIVGDISGNKNKIISLIEESEKQNADIIVFPELATIGYPPMDLLENKTLIKQNINSLNEIASKVSDTAVVIGAATTDESGNIFNSALFISQGKIIRTYNKTLLPNYDVFDEERYFTSGNSYLPIEFKGIRIALTVCEDIWNCEDSEFTGGRKYDLDPVSIYAEKKIDLLINISTIHWYLTDHPSESTKKDRSHQPENILKKESPIIYSLQKMRSILTIIS